MRATPARLCLSLAAFFSPAAYARGPDPGTLKFAHALGATPAPLPVSAPERAGTLVLRLDWRLGQGTLLAQAGDALAQAGPAREPQEPEPPPRKEDESLLGGVRWGLAPIRWGGSLTTDLRHFSAHGQPSRLQQVESAQLRVASYVWQPWFMQVAGAIGGVMSSERGEGSSRSTSLTGSGEVNVLSTSRFPFRAHFSVDDNRTSDQFLGQSYQSRRFGVRQSYRNERGDENYSASFDRSTLLSPSFGRDTVNVFAANHNRTFGRHALSASANFTRNERGNSGEAVGATSLYASHSFSSEDRLFSLNTFANYGESDARTASPLLRADFRTQVYQLSSTFSWKRDEDDPLYVTGGARYLSSQTSAGGAPAETQQVTGFGSASYRASRNLSFNAGASVTRNLVSLAGNASTVTSLTGGANYTVDPKRIGEFTYTANLGANAQSLTGVGNEHRMSAGGNVTHGLQRSYDFSRNHGVSVGVSQSVSLLQDNVAGGSQRLTHGANASWRASYAEWLSGSLSASAVDARSFGTGESSFQSLNLGANGQGQLSRFSTASVNLAWQGTRQETPGSPASGFNWNLSGGASYHHFRVFGVPRLRYFAQYNRNDYRINARLLGDLNAPREVVNSDFEQRLEYNIGKVDARLSLRFTELDGKKNALLFFRLSRQLGDL